MAERDAEGTDFTDGAENRSNAKELEKPKFNLTLKVFRFCTWAEYLLIGLGFVCFAGNGLMMPLFMLVFGDLVDSIGGIGPRPFTYYIKLQMIIAAASFALSYVGSSALEISAERQIRVLRKRFLASVLNQEIAWFDTFESGTLASKLSLCCNQLRDAIGVKLGQLVMFLAMFIGGYAVGFIRGWKLTLVLTASLPLLALSGAVMMKVLASTGEESRKLYERAGAIAEESIGSVRTVVAFGAEENVVSRFSAEVDHSFRASFKGGFFKGAGMGFAISTLFLAYALGYWYGGRLVADDLARGCTGDHCMTGGRVLAVFFAVIIAAFGVGQAGPNVSAFSLGSNAALDLFQIIDRTSSIDPRSSDGIDEGKLKGDIVFENVRFAYPTRLETPVFTNLNLRIPAGKTVAIVGGSGCGKSTVVQLLQRFYDTESGRITVDGRDIREYNLQWMRQQMAVVNQEPRLFSTSLASNIRYGRLDATSDDIVEAAKNANALKFVNDFPDKFETTAGMGGFQVSGGQKQRLAIARAVIRDPTILILDEATSALDNESESVVQSTLDELVQSKGRTTLIIAHRLSTIRNADLIVVLNNSGSGSQVVEQGSHDELLKIPDGLYANLINAQMLPLDRKLSSDLAKRISDEFSCSTSPIRTRSIRALSKKFDSFSELNTIEEVTPPEKSKESKKSYRCFKTKSGAPEGPPSPSFLKVAKRLKHDWWKVILGLVGAAGNGTIFPLFAIPFSYLLEVFFNPDPTYVRSQTNFWSLMFVVEAVAVFILCGTQSFFFEWIGQGFVRDMRKDTLSNLLYQEISFFDDPKHNTGHLTQLLAADIPVVRGWVGDNTSLMVQNLSALITGAIISFFASAKLAAVLLASTLILVPAGMLEMKFWKGSETAHEFGSVINEPINEVRLVASYSLQSEMIMMFGKAVDKQYYAGRRKAFIFASFFAFSQFIQFGIQALALWYGSELLKRGEVSSVSKMMMAIFALLMAAMGIGQASAFLTDTGKAQEAARNVYNVLDRESAIDARRTSGENLGTSFKGSIEFKDVNFVYPQRPGVKVYQNLSFSVLPGQTVALVGESGCGKSTAIQLLERFYDPITNESGGGVNVDSIAVPNFNLKYLRSRMGLVSQEPALFSSSILENIKLGKPEASYEEVITAAKLANIHDTIMSFPDGYETEVGKIGGKLSGGQKQRVSIARAMIRDPNILLLDEATSALDAESEKVVQSALDELLRETRRTTIVIAHRLSTVRNADKIVVLSNADKQGSRVVEEGTHNELANKPDGIYANLLKIVES